MSASPSDPVDLYFIETRHKLLDLAAFLDRVDRADAADDYRVRALKDALPLLSADRPERARRILDHFSDASIEPIPNAHGKGAAGAPPPTEDAP